VPVLEAEESQQGGSVAFAGLVVSAELDAAAPKVARMGEKAPAAAELAKELVAAQAAAAAELPAGQPLDWDAAPQRQEVVA